MPRTPDIEARDRVVSAASRLFYERGIRAVGMNEVIAEAGCGKNLVYRYFPGKVDLVAEYLDRFLAVREAEALAAADAAGDDPRQQVLALTRDIVDHAHRRWYRGCAARNYLVESRGDPDRATKIAKAYLHRTRADLHRRVSATGVADPDAVTEKICLVQEGLYGAALYLGGRRASAEQAVALVDSLLRSA